MKKVFTNALCVQAWANQAQETGKNSNNSIFFEGDTIYSWGYHFPMARIDGSFAFINSADYSSSTSAHKSLVCSEISKTKIVFTVPDILNCTEDNYHWLCKQITITVAKANRARSAQAMLLRRAKEMIEQAKAYHSTFLTCEVFEYPELDLIE